jgi:hypothetical protein
VNYDTEVMLWCCDGKVRRAAVASCATDAGFKNGFGSNGVDRCSTSRGYGFEADFGVICAMEVEINKHDIRFSRTEVLPVTHL